MEFKKISYWFYKNYYFKRIVG